MPLPQIQIAFNGWQSSVVLKKLTSLIVDFEKVTSEQDFNFSGVVQPLMAEELRLKPLDQRSWEWLMIHTRPDISLKTGDLISYNGKEFKVMGKKDYTQNAFIEYHAVKNYE